MGEELQGTGQGRDNQLGNAALSAAGRWQGSKEARRVGVEKAALSPGWGVWDSGGKNSICLWHRAGIPSLAPSPHPFPTLGAQGTGQINDLKIQRDGNFSKDSHGSTVQFYPR